MSTRDEDFSKQLKETLRLKRRPPVTRQDIEEFLSAPGADSETVERVRARSVEKSFRALHRKPVMQIMGMHAPAFGEWIAATRRKARLPLKQIARVLKQEPAFIEQLESGETAPWQIDAETVAALVKLYRAHIDVVERLIRHTEGAMLSTSLPPTTRTEPRTDGMQTYMIDRFSSRSEFRPEVAQWLSELRAALQRLQATDLLSY